MTRSGTRLRPGASVGRPPAVGLRGLVVLALALAAGLTTVAAASELSLAPHTASSRLDRPRNSSRAKWSFDSIAHRPGRI